MTHTIDTECSADDLQTFLDTFEKVAIADAGMGQHHPHLQVLSEDECKKIAPKNIRAINMIKEIIKMKKKDEEELKEIDERLSTITICPHCFCMTHTIDKKCGKCKKVKYPEAQRMQCTRCNQTWTEELRGGESVEYKRTTSDQYDLNAFYKILSLPYEHEVSLITCPKCCRHDKVKKHEDK